MRRRLKWTRQLKSGIALVRCACCRDRGREVFIRTANSSRIGCFFELEHHNTTIFEGVPLNELHKISKTQPKMCFNEWKSPLPKPVNSFLAVERLPPTRTYFASNNDGKAEAVAFGESLNVQRASALNLHFARYCSKKIERAVDF